MSNLLNSLVGSANALRAYDQVLQVAQNNVANASTPGFVKQRQTLLAMAFDPASGLNGGVRAGEVQSARSAYADQAVRRQTVLLGKAQQDVEGLTAIQSSLDVSGDSGIPRALNRLFQGFSGWAQSPQDATARQTVIERASDVATAFRQMAGNLTQESRDAEGAFAQAVDAVNTLTGQLQTLNRLARQGAGNDAGLDARMRATIEELAQYASFTALEQEDGAVTVLLDGQVALVAGDQQYRLSTKLAQPEDPPPSYPDGPASLRLVASDGSDITDQAVDGKLGALLDLRNRVLPSYLGDANQQGDLNRMAQQFADRVNGLLAGGIVSDGPPPQPGTAIFSYGDEPTAIARTLDVDRAAVKPELLAAIQEGPPRVANGVPLALSALADPSQDADEIDGVSFTAFYGRMASRTGSELGEAESRVDIQQAAVEQAKNMRQLTAGVSLDEEAAILIQFQRAYEANSRLISVLDRLTEAAVEILQR